MSPRQPGPAILGLAQQRCSVGAAPGSSCAGPCGVLKAIRTIDEIYCALYRRLSCHPGSTSSSSVPQILTRLKIDSVPEAQPNCERFLKRAAVNKRPQSFAPSDAHCAHSSRVPNGALTRGSVLPATSRHRSCLAPHPRRSCSVPPPALPPPQDSTYRPARRSRAASQRGLRRRAPGRPAASCS